MVSLARNLERAEEAPLTVCPESIMQDDNAVEHEAN